MYEKKQLKKSIYCKNDSPIWVNDAMSGKMEDIPCIGTSLLLNPFCKARQKIDGFICGKCYANRSLNVYSKLELKMAHNTAILTTEIIPDEYLPKFKRSVDIARFEPFGDIINKTQVINYFNICKVNPLVTFALWSKNMNIVKQVVETIGKPNNLVIIESSPKINEMLTTKYSFVDKTFSVFTTEYIATNNLIVNCGAKDCDGCRKCYNTEDKTKYIIEKLK